MCYGARSDEVEELEAVTILSLVFRGLEWLILRYHGGDRVDNSAVCECYDYLTLRCRQISMSEFSFASSHSPGPFHRGQSLLD